MKKLLRKLDVLLYKWRLVLLWKVTFWITLSQNLERLKESRIKKLIVGFLLSSRLRKLLQKLQIGLVKRIYAPSMQNLCTRVDPYEAMLASKNKSLILSNYALQKTNN